MKTRTQSAAAPAGEGPRTPTDAGGWWEHFPAPLAALAIYFGLAVVYFLPAFFPGRQIYGTDFLVGGYFFHEFISDRFAQGDLPKWVPHVYGGVPIFANPGSTFYPFRFLADAIFPVSLLWPTLFIIHFTLAGWGTYLLSRELDVRRWVAWVAGLAFQFTGITMSWVLAGHEGRIIVATLTPLAFYFIHRGVRTGALAPFAGLAATVGFALLTFQIQNSYYLLLGGLIWAVFSLWNLGTFRRPRALARAVALGVGAVAFGFGMAAVNFLPFLDYIEQSPRGGGGRGYEYAVSWSMPLREITAVAVPEDVGHLETYTGTNPMKLHTEYAGATVLALVAVGFAVARRDRRWWFFLGLGLFALTIALGGSTPIYRLYYEFLPGTKRFRAASISFFLVSFSLVMMAAIALEALAARWEERRAEEAKRLRRSAAAETPFQSVGWILAGVVALGVLLGAVAAGTGPRGEPGAGALAFRFALFAAAVAAILWLWLQDRLGRVAAMLLLAGVTVLDLWIVDRKFFETVPGPEELFAMDDVAMFLDAQPGRDRAWVLPFPPGAVYRGQAGNYLMQFDLDQVGGEHGNQLQRWNEYLGAGENVYVDWHNFLQYPAFLNAANVRYIIAGVQLPEPFREVYRGSALVYENPGALPRAYLVPQAAAVQGEDAALARMQDPAWDPRRTAFVQSPTPIELPDTPLEGVAEVVEYTPDRVVVRARANRPALLVLADNYYEEWEVEIDGAPGEILRTNHALRGVLVPAGEHRVVFTFRPEGQRTGWIVYLVTMAILAGYGGLLLIRALRRRKSPEA